MNNFIIVFTPRSGSTYIAKSLSNKSRTYLGEYLNSRNGVLRGDYIEHNRYYKYIKLINKKKPYVLKITSLDIFKLMPFIIVFLKDKKNNIILIDRNDKYKQLLSFLYVSEIKNHHIYNESYIEHLKKINCEKKYFDIFFHEIELFQQIKFIFHRYNIKYKMIIYENIAEEITRFSKNDFKKDNKYRIPVKSDLNYEDYISNLEDIHIWHKEFCKSKIR